MDWAEATYEVDVLKNCFCLAGLYFHVFGSRMGSFSEMMFFVAILKQCEVENDAD